MKNVRCSAYAGPLPKNEPNPATSGSRAITAASSLQALHLLVRHPARPRTAWIKPCLESGEALGIRMNIATSATAARTPQASSLDAATPDRARRDSRRSSHRSPVQWCDRHDRAACAGLQEAAHSIGVRSDSMTTDTPMPPHRKRDSRNSRPMMPPISSSGMNTRPARCYGPSTVSRSRAPSTGARCAGVPFSTWR